MKPTTDSRLWKDLIVAAVVCAGSVAYVARQIKSAEPVADGFRRAITQT